ALSLLAGRSARLREAWRLGLLWSAGHTLTIALVAALPVVSGLHVPPRLFALAEVAVAALLLGLGVSVIVQHVRGRWHLHVHTHDGVRHVHLHPHARSSGHDHVHVAATRRWALGLGLVHGLAGSGAVLVLLVAMAPTRIAQVSWLAAFGLGTGA